jgi:hypothetical protein
MDYIVWGEQMKKSFFLIITILSLVLSLYSVLAGVSVTPSSIDFGKANWDESIKKSITVKNNGSEDYLITISSTASSNEYSIDLERDSFVISPNSEEMIDVESSIRKDNAKLEGGNKNMGDIVIKSNGSTISTIPMTITALPRLQISNLDVKVVSSTDSDLGDGDTIGKKAKAGDEIEFSVELENLFHKDDSEYDIEDANIKVTIKEIDDGDDLEDETDDFIIDAGSKKTSTLDIIIPEVVKSGTYNVIIDVQGKNAKVLSNKYSYQWKLKLDVEKKKHDVVIDKVELSPAFLACGVKTTILNVGLINMGDSVEDEVTIEVKNPNLNLNERFTGINLGSDYDSDARYQKNIKIDVSDEFNTPGIYPLTVNVYYSNEILDDIKTVDLEIKSCNPDEEQTVAEAPAVEEEAVPVTPIIEEGTDESDLQATEEQTVAESSMMPDVVLKSLDVFDASRYLVPILGFLLVSAIIITIVIVLIKRV